MEDTSHLQNPDGSSMKTADAVGQLIKREIQAPLAACLVREFADHLGFEKALAIATKAVQKDAEKIGKMMSETYGKTIEDLYRVIKEVWANDNAIEFEIIEKTKHRLRFNVVHCQYVELYDKLRLKDFGFCLSCSRDAYFAKGFNPKMKFERRQTLMQGASFCDLCFTV